MSDEERRVLFEKNLGRLGKHESLSMSDKPILFKARRERVDVESLIDSCRSDPNRILADDEVGLVVYVGDMDIYRHQCIGTPGDGQPASRSERTLGTES